MKHLIKIFLFISTLSFSQDMTKGFEMLEKGNFNEAEQFFTVILKDFPTNKTAKICYARALGLSSNPNEALNLFKSLQETYPNDLEIDLNYAEALLWNKKFDEAKIFYDDLVKKNPDNFVAHLGFANTLSNLKEFSQALLLVNRALELSPNNPGAIVSRKYIKLGYANTMIPDKKYDEADQFYDEILLDFPNDKETLLNKANLYLISKQIEKGKAIYNQLKPENELIALNGLSLLDHLNGKSKNALIIADESLQKSKTNSNQSLVKQTKERYAQALIWNKKFKEAKTFIDNLFDEYGQENWILALRATLSVYKSDFNKSILDYESILAKDSLSFDGNLGVANAYYADGFIKKAYQAVFQTLKVFPKQNDASNFLKKLHAEHSPIIEQRLSYAFDNGDNIAYASLTQIALPVSTKWSFNASYQYREASNEITKVKALTNDLMVGSTFKFHQKASLTALLGVSQATGFTKSYEQFLAHTFLKLKPYKLQDLEIGYRKEMQNFNADLIDKEIASHHYYLNYNLSTNKRVGWFTQYFYTTQSDNNVRNLLFTSLYYNFLAKPILKGGVNYQYISFKNQIPLDYFSPATFNAVELFFDLLKDENIAEKKSIYYHLSGAIGLQYIEDNEKQNTYRVQTKFGYRFTDNFRAHIYGLRSNIASTTAAGFTYNELGINLRLIIGKKPIFKTE